MFNWFRKKQKRPDGAYEHGNTSLIELRQVFKTYKTAAGEFTALKNVSMQANKAEFVAVIGKSGSGKSTLINMITGIDRPSAGEVFVGDTAVHTLSEEQMALWRGRHLGIIFQFFQLLPTLTVIDNVMLPMDLCNMYTPGERVQRALRLLKEIDMVDQAYKLPSALSGGQQQRVAIARALANDPPILVADEPTGNLDSKTAAQVFALFERLVREGKTILMVTHDNDLARRATRSIIVADGEIVNEYVLKALPALTIEQLGMVMRQIDVKRYHPGEEIISAGGKADNFYIITRGSADILLDHPDGSEILVEQIQSGQYFGEIELRRGAATNRATIRASAHMEVEVVMLDRSEFDALLAQSEPTRRQIDETIQQRLATAPSIG